MSGSCRRRLLPPLLVALVTFTGCAATGPDDGSPEPLSADDARPVLGTAPGPLPDAPSGPPPTTTGATPATALDGGYEQWLPVALDRLTARTVGEPVVPREVFCEQLPAEDCLELPAELPERVVRMFDWFRETDGHVPVPHELLRTTAVSCLLLDELSWEEQVVLLGDRAESATDLSALAYGAVALMTPVAVVFVCPEHDAATREQMTAAVCDGSDPEACDQLVEAWPVT